MLDASSLRPKGSDVSTAPAITASDALTGRWVVDPGHSSVDFRVRHAGVARVRGTFDVFEGELVVAPDGGITARGIRKELEVVGHGCRPLWDPVARMAPA